MEVRWRIEMLGGLRAAGTHEVGRGDCVVTRFRTQKTGALLAYLAFHLPRSHIREHLIELLWPEADLESGRRSLSTALSWLRHLLEGPGVPPGTVLVTDRTSVRLNPEVVRTDVAELETALHAVASGKDAERREELTRAVALYRGELLPGFYESWVLGQRERLADLYFRAVRQLEALLEDAGELQRALEYARQGVSADPLREEAQYDLIRLLIAVGQPAAARRQYRELERLLQQELGSTPAVATRALLQETEHAVVLPANPPRPRPRFRDTCPNNLLTQPTPLIGREREVRIVQDLLRREETRLVTLTGPAGAGKTRLALEVAADCLDAFPDGVFFVALASIQDPALVGYTIAQTLCVREAGGQPLQDSLKEYLRQRQFLLILDNFEQVLSAAPLLAELLGVAPRLKLLVTSRAVLHLCGEHQFPVPPLALPDRHRLPPVDVLAQYPAVALFLQRAVAVQPEFVLTQENAPAVAEICHRLDGLPLAIELAAARIKLFPPRTLLSRLERRLPLLTGGAQDLPVRQQTLQDAIGWSHDLLEESEKRLFRRLSVFVGGFSLEAAEAVYSASGELEIGVLEGVASLVDKSLLRPQEGAEGEPRFEMLETIREYGLECLESSGEAQAIRRRHTQFFLRLAESGGGSQRKEIEHDNLRAALSWAVRSGEATASLRIGLALHWFWYVRGYLAEGRERLMEVLGLPGAQSRTTMRAKTLLGVGQLARCQGDYAAARAAIEESLAISQELGDQWGIAESFRSLGEVACSQGDYEAAWALIEDSLEMFWRLGNRCEIAYSLAALGGVAQGEGDYGGAGGLYAVSLALYREQGKSEALIADDLRNLGHVAYCQGNHARAAARFIESLTILWEQGYMPPIPACLVGLSEVAHTQGERERAARLLGAAAALMDVIGACWPSVERAAYERQVAAVCARLGHEAFAAAWAAGRELSLDQAVALALDETR
jgi:predicted ATPase/DNA-binding SARP family transcriptional activator